MCAARDPLEVVELDELLTAEPPRNGRTPDATDELAEGFVDLPLAVEVDTGRLQLASLSAGL